MTGRSLTAASPDLLTLRGQRSAILVSRLFRSPQMPDASREIHRQDELFSARVLVAAWEPARGHTSPPRGPNKLKTCPILFSTLTRMFSVLAPVTLPTNWRNRIMQSEFKSSQSFLVVMYAVEVKKPNINNANCINYCRDHCNYSEACYYLHRPALNLN